MRTHLVMTAWALTVAFAGLAASVDGGNARSLPLAQAEALRAGVPAAGDVAFALTGVTEVRATSLTFYGYVSALDGLTPERLFVGGADRSEATARIVYFGFAETGARTDRAGATVLTAEGTIEFHFQEQGGATFAAPESFFGGPIVANGEIRQQLVLDTGSTGGGLGTGTAILALEPASAFTIDGTEYQFGEPELGVRWTSSGIVEAQSSSSRPFTFAHTGSAYVTGQQGASLASSLPGPTPEPILQATVTPDPACADIVPWLTETFERVGQLAAVATLVPDDAAIDTINAEAVRELSATLTTLAAAQRDGKVPASEAAANRLLVTVFSTYGRGLNLLASAVASGSSSVFDRALTIIDEARTLEATARETLAEIAVRCEFQSANIRAGEVSAGTGVLRLTR